MPTYEDLLNDQIEELEQFTDRNFQLVALEIRALRLEISHLVNELHNVVEELASK